MPVTPSLPPPNIDILGSPAIFAKVMFDYLIGLYAMFDKYKFIHSDLHLNNITVDINIRRKRDYPHAYVINNDIFVFTGGHINGYIIDLSRCIIGDPSIIANDYGDAAFEKYMKNGFVHQREWILRVLKVHLGDFMARHERDIANLLEKNHAIAIEAIAALDFFQLSSNISKLFAIESPTVHPDNVEFINALRIASEKQLIGNITKALAEQFPVLDSPYYIIQELFAKYNMTEDIIQKRTINLTNIGMTYESFFIDDVFSLQIGKSLKYSIDSYDFLPDLAKVTLDLRLREKFPQFYDGTIDPATDYRREYKREEKTEQLANVRQNFINDVDNSWMFE
jgi:hypothetical protein